MFVRARGSVEQWQRLVNHKTTLHPHRPSTDAYMTMQSFLVLEVLSGCPGPVCLGLSVHERVQFVESGCSSGLCFSSQLAVFFFFIIFCFVFMILGFSVHT